MRFISKSISLSEISSDRNNNFNLIRVIAAVCVLISHCYPLSSPHFIEPLKDKIGFTLGALCVDVFFITSGFLIHQSLLSNPGKLYIKNRFLRVYPALWLMLILTVFFLGPVCSKLNYIAYFSDSKTIKFLLTNSILLTGIRYELPGVFTENPYAYVVNGSLWTLAVEVRLYIELFLSYWIINKLNLESSKIYKIICLLGIAVFIFLIFILYLDFNSKEVLRATTFFCGGILLNIFKHKILLIFGLLPILLFTLISAATLMPEVFRLLYILMLPYMVILVAYYPGEKIRAYNQLGDYSYGIYIYAFPIQQLIVSRVQIVSPISLFCISLPLTVFISMLSWHLIEIKLLRRFK